MPRPLLISAILFIGFGMVCLLCKLLLGFSIPAPLWIILSALLAGIELLRGHRSGRFFAALVIVFGYISTSFDLVDYLKMPNHGALEIWGIYGRAFLAIAILTLVSSFLWSRSVSIYLNRFNDVTRTEK